MREGEEEFHPCRPTLADCLCRCSAFTFLTVCHMQDEHISFCGLVYKEIFLYIPSPGLATEVQALALKKCMQNPYFSEDDPMSLPWWVIQDLTFARNEKLIRHTSIQSTFIIATLLLMKIICVLKHWLLYLHRPLFRYITLDSNTDSCPGGNLIFTLRYNNKLCHLYC